MRMHLRSFEAILGFTRNEQMGWWTLFKATEMVPITQTMLQVMLALLGTFWDKNMTGPGEVRKYPKNNLNWRLYTPFEFSRGLSFGRHRMLPRDLGDHWKEVMWLGTNMWMPLRSFRGNFGFHEKWTNGVLEAFRGNGNGAKHPDYVTSHVGTLRNVWGYKKDRA